MAKAKESRGAERQRRPQEEARVEGRQQPLEGGRQQSPAMQTSGEGGGRQTELARREQHAPAPWSGGSPFSFMRRFSEEMDRLFEDFGFGRGLFSPSFARGLSGLGEAGGAMWSPQVEVFERGGQLVVRADLPGMAKEDIDIEVTDNALLIRGERRQEREEDEEGYYRSERSYGSFYRQIPLPEGTSAEGANATFRDGVLEITMPVPRRESRSRRLEIREGTEAEGRRERASAKAAGR